MDFFEFGKNWKFDDPPSDLILEDFEFWELITYLFLGRVVARAPMCGFVILPASLSQLASGEVLRVAIGFEAV